MAVAAPQYGLYGKYRVTHPGSDTELLDVFVLRPSRDPHARRALLAYAAASPDLRLRADLYRWLASIAEAEASGGVADFPIPAPVAARLRADAAVDGAVEPEHPVVQATKQIPGVPPDGAPIQVCSSCGQQMFFGWVIRKDGTHGDRPSPYDWPPTEHGGHMLYVGEQDGRPAFRQASNDEQAAAHARGEVLWTNHFSTCRDAAQHRRT